MGEQTGSRLNHRSAICKFPSEKIRKKQLRRRRSIIMAVSLGFILTTTGLVYYLMLPPPFPPFIPPEPIETTPHAPIEIIGDANFSETALLEGWPGDGSPENPYIINGLEIDLGGGNNRRCIEIRDTQVRFSISNCNLTGAYPFSFGGSEAGIYLENVMNGELVDNIVDSNYNGIILGGSDYNTVADNTCSSNTNYGIILDGSDYNTVANNTCSNNGEYGISLHESFFNTVSDNTCNSNTATPGDHLGISLIDSHFNIVADNTCNSNRIGIYLRDSCSNTLADNTCNSNTIGIYLLASYSNTVVNNICLSNTERDMLEEFDTREDDNIRIGNILLLIQFVAFIEFIIITLLGGIWIVVKRVSKEGN